jgi:hypothetical protein
MPERPVVNKLSIKADLPEPGRNDLDLVPSGTRSSARVVMELDQGEGCANLYEPRELPVSIGLGSVA